MASALDPGVVLDAVLRELLGCDVDEVDGVPEDIGKDLDLLAGGEGLGPVEDVTMSGVAVLGEYECGDPRNVVGIDDRLAARTGRVNDAVLGADPVGPRKRVRHEDVWPQIGDVQSRLAEQILAGGECHAHRGQRPEAGADGGKQHDPVHPGGAAASIMIWVWVVPGPACRRNKLWRPCSAGTSSMRSCRRPRRDVITCCAQAGGMQLRRDGKPVIVPVTIGGDLPASVINVAHIYARLRDDIASGVTITPGFEDAVRLSRLIDSLIKSDAEQRTVILSVEWP